MNPFSKGLEPSGTLIIARATNITLPEDDLQRAYSLFSARDYKNAAKAAEKARKRLEREDPARSYEALRVQADSTLNARDIKGAESLYTELMRVAQSKSLLFYQAAASW